MKKEKPYYLVVFKTPNDEVYTPLDGMTSLRKATAYAYSQVRELRRFRSPNIDAAQEVHIVIEEWDSEEAFDRTEGRVGIIYDRKIIVRPDYERLEGNL